MKLEDIKKELENGVLAIASADKNGKPHNIAVMFAKVVDGKIIITANYMKKTLENINETPIVSLVFWKGEKGWSIEGDARFYSEGNWMDFVKQLPENNNFNPKGALVITPRQIKEIG